MLTHNLSLTSFFWTTRWFSLMCFFSAAERSNFSPHNRQIRSGLSLSRPLLPTLRCRFLKCLASSTREEKFSPQMWQISTGDVPGPAIDLLEFFLPLVRRSSSSSQGSTWKSACLSNLVNEPEAPSLESSESAHLASEKLAGKVFLLLPTPVERFRFLDKPSRPGSSLRLLLVGKIASSSSPELSPKFWSPKVRLLFSKPERSWSGTSSPKFDARDVAGVRPSAWTTFIMAANFQMESNFERSSSTWS